jgi:hypothetical protein
MRRQSFCDSILVSVGAPFAELLKLATSSVADELDVLGNRTVIGE